MSVVHVRRIHLILDWHETMTAIPHRRLTGFHEWRILTRDIVKNAKALLRRSHRDAKIVEAEYDGGFWQSVLEDKRWLRCQNVHQYVVHDNDVDHVAKIGDNRLVRITQRDYYEFRLKRLQDVLSIYLEEDDQLVELGCGCGTNIFSLTLAKRWQSLSGFDISPKGVQAAREAASHFQLGNVHFDLLDLTDSGAEQFAALEGSGVFTYYCFEQLKYVTRTVLENIVRARPRRVVHIEPTFELLKWTSLADWATRLYVMRMDYQNNLYRTLRELEKEGRVRILDVKRLYYGPTHRNDPTLICWEPA